MELTRNFISYITKSGLEDTSYNSKIIDIDPVVWILNKNNESIINYSLLNWTKMPVAFPNPIRVFITYAVQSSITSAKIYNEVIYQNPFTWINNKNNISDLKYVLLNWKILKYVSSE